MSALWKLCFLFQFLGTHPSLAIPHSEVLAVHWKLEEHSKNSAFPDGNTEWNGKVGDVESSELSVQTEGEKEVEVCLALQKFSVCAANNAKHLHKSCWEPHVSWFPAPPSRRPIVWAHWRICCCWDLQHAGTNDSLKSKVGDGRSHAYLF